MSRQASVLRLTSSIGGSIASIKSLLSKSKIHPVDVDNSDTVYEIKDFDNYSGEKSNSEQNLSSSADLFLLEDDNHACGKKFLRVIRRAWSTRYTEELSSNKVVFLKTALRELVTYLVFLIFLMMVAYGTRSENLYYLTTAMSNILITSNFNGITAMDSFWNWINIDFVNALYWNTWYNSMTYLPLNEREFIHYENKLVGVPQIRQLRIGSNTCQIPSFFKNSMSNCYGDYSFSNLNKSDFGISNSTAWSYTPPNSTYSSSFSATFATYDDGGFIQVLSRNSLETISILSNLQNNLWLDHGTRAVFIDLTVYNANVNLYCVIKLIFEFPPTGGIIPSSQFRTLKLIRYETGYDFFILFCEIVVIFYVIYYFIEEFIEIKKNKLSYFKKIWNVVDVLMIIMSFISIAINVYRVLSTNKVVKQLVNNQNNYVDFTFFANWNKYFNDAVSITTFFGAVKIFKYISFNKTMNQLTDTLSNSIREMMGFAVMFFIVFFAFAGWGYLQFGSQIVDFCRFQDSVFTLFRLVLGDFNFMALVQANSFIGPVYFLCYVFFVFFVLMNMFVAIIADSYEVVKEKLMQSKDEFQITKFLKAQFFNKFTKNRVMKIQEVLENENIANCETLSYQDWRDKLQSRGYADVEIQALFMRYDSDGDRTLDYEERRVMLQDLKNGKISLEGHQTESNESELSVKKEDESMPVDEELFGGLVERVDSVEKNISNIVSKIDMVFLRLSEIEKAKLDHQKSISCSLSILTGSQINVLV
uniref:PKD2-1 n=1 Tax=Schmidtea mediterranea TaxID=79327 RepID=A0A0H3YFQ9_SCHMD|nr:PKD2-1 [Schmidtea mediterranea]